jgi:hypothetical protein
MVLMTLVTLPMAAELALSARTVTPASAAISRAWRAIFADSLALPAISRTVALSSSAATATEATFALICSAALETFDDCVAVSVELAASCAATSESDVDASSRREAALATSASVCSLRASRAARSVISSTLSAGPV